jgi:hypothetical protein
LVNKSLAHLDVFYAQLRKKKNDKPADRNAILKQKLIQEDALKNIERLLFELFHQCQEPYWLNLILIENCKDLTVKKYSK